MALLKLLDDAYLAVRYDEGYRISKEQIHSLRLKANIILDAARATFLDIWKFFSQVHLTVKGADNDVTPHVAVCCPSLPDLIRNQITDAFDVERIYCFGRRNISTSRFSLFADALQSQSAHMHYDLLLITGSQSSQNPADLQSTINSGNDHQASVLLLVHCRSSGNLASKVSERFLHHILRFGEQIYTRPGSGPAPELHAYDQTDTLLKCQSSWQQRLFRAEAFLDAAECIWVDKDETVVLSLISQATEQICLGLIYIYLGYRPRTHSLNHLMDLISNFTDEADAIFPRLTEEDKVLFRMLAHSVNKARFVTRYAIDVDNSGILHRRAKSLMEKSISLVQEKLIALQQTASASSSAD